MIRAVVVAMAINLICVIALLWSANERLHVTVVVSGGSVTGSVGSTTVTAPVTGGESGQVGLFLQGADPHAANAWPASSVDTPAPPAPSLSERLYRLAAESAWTNVRVKDLATNQAIYPTTVASAAGADWRPRFGDWFHHPFGGETTPRPGLATLGSPGSHAYQLDADLLRPRNAAGVLVLSPDGTNGMLLYFRPEDRDAMWYRVSDGQWLGPVASAPFHTFQQSAVSSVEDVLRLALGGYPGAVGIVVVALALGTLEEGIWKRWSRFRPHRKPLSQGEGSGELVAMERDGIATEIIRESFARGLVPRRQYGASGGQAPARSDTMFAAGAIDDGVHARSVASLAPTLAALVLVGVALVSTLYVADSVLQRLPHVQDSVAYLFQAKTFALGRLSVPIPPDPDFFKHEFIVMDHGQWFSKYPPGWPMLLALGVLVNAPWVVDPICAALSIFVIYRLGSEIYRPRVGVLAAALGVVSPFFLFLSGSMMSHSSGLLFALLFAWGFWRIGRSSRPVVPAVLCGAAFGMGFLIRPYTMIVIALPFALYAGWAIGRGPAAGLRRYLPSVAAMTPFVVGFLAYNAHFTGNPLYPPQQLWWAFDSVGFGPQHGPWGFTPLDALNNTSRNLLELVEHTYGWPEFLTLSLAMVPFLVGRSRKWDWLFAAGFAALVAGYGLWWADGIMYGPRFYYEGLGFLLLLTARGIDEVLNLARSGLAPLPQATEAARRAVAAPALVYVFVALLVAFNFAFYFPGQWQLYHGYNYVNRSKLDAVERAGIHDALVFADVGQWYEWWEYGMVFSANDPLLRGDVIFARDLGAANDEKLMADFPGRSFYRLNGTELSPLTPMSPTGANSAR